MHAMRRIRLDGTGQDRLPLLGDPFSTFGMLLSTLWSSFPQKSSDISFQIRLHEASPLLLKLSFGTEKESWMACERRGRGAAERGGA